MHPGCMRKDNAFELEKKATAKGSCLEEKSFPFLSVVFLVLINLNDYAEKIINGELSLEDSLRQMLPFRG